MPWKPDRRHLRPLLVLGAAAGDLLIFASFVALTPLGHGVVQLEAFPRTALPFAGVWVAAAPWAGAFRVSTLASARVTLWRIPLVWLGCGAAAIALRVWLTDRSFSWAFTLASIAAVAAMLLAWRLLYTLAARRLAARPAPDARGAA